MDGRGYQTARDGETKGRAMRRATAIRYTCSWLHRLHMHFRLLRKTQCLRPSSLLRLMREDDATSMMCGQRIDLDGEVAGGRAAPSERDVIIVRRQLVAGEVLSKTKIGVDGGCVPDHASAFSGVACSERGEQWFDPV